MTGAAEKNSNSGGGAAATTTGEAAPSGNNSEDNTSSVSLTPETVLNLNVGVLGHVDSGKTSLVKALSTLLSTAALDKSKQSRQRGMTLDLGFSCFFLHALPQHLQTAFPEKKVLQITLVDCPGHASLIRTIIGGAQIIDIVLLVVDAVKGWQAQTTECLVLAELSSPHLIVALNKIDQFPPEQRESCIAKAAAQVRERLQSTRFGSQNVPIVGVAACVGGEKVAAAKAGPDSDSNPTTSASSVEKNETNNIQALIQTLQDNLPIPNRGQSQKGDFYFAIDHCFPIRGRGTVLTGTCLSGSIAVNDVIEFPHLGLDRKIKSMQMFKRQITDLGQGDRAGICVSNLDSKLLERGIASAPPGSVQLWKGAIALVRKVKYFPATLPGNSKFHISVGHTTVMATVTFWGAKELAKQQADSIAKSSQGEGNAEKSGYSTSLAGDAAGLPRIAFDFNEDFLQQDGLMEAAPSEPPLLQWALLDFQTPVHCPLHSLVIGSRLDAVDNTAGSSLSSGATSSASCRLAFSGRLVERIDPSIDTKRLRIYVPKEKRGVISRLGDPHKRSDDGKVVRYEVFGSDLFKKETNMKVFLGMKLVTASGDIGEIKSSFGTSGKFRVYFPAGTQAKEGEPLLLQFKRFANDPDKAMHQDLSLPAARSGSRIEVEKKKPKKLEQGVQRFGEVASLKGDVLENGKRGMAIVSGFFAPEINIKEKAGTKVVVQTTKEEGNILGPFGKAGKCKVAFEHGVSAKVGDKVELKL